MKRRWTWWGIPLVMCVVALVVPALVVYHQRTVPLEECSEVYRRYRDVPGIRAAFVKDKQINDSLRLDVTLLQAEDSMAFVQMLGELGKSEESIVDMMRTPLSNRDSRFTGIYHGTGEEASDIMVIFPVRRDVAVFHTNGREDAIDILMTVNLKETLIINEE